MGTIFLGKKWNRHVSYILYNRDCSKEYKVHRRKLKSLRLYGVKGLEDFLTMSVCLEFRDFYLLFDRATHNPGDMMIRNPKIGESKKINRILYTLIWKEAKDYNPNPVDKDFPISDTNCIGKSY